MRTVSNLHTLSVATPPEEFTCRPVLERLMRCIQRRCEGGEVVYDSKVRSKLLKLVLSGLASRPEYAVRVHGVAMIASEAKRVMHSLLFAMPQALAMAADIARSLRRLLADVDAAYATCVAVLSAGDTVQFAAAYLFDVDYPGFCLLSKPLNVFCQNDLREVWAWVEEVAVDATNKRSRILAQPTIPPQLRKDDAPELKLRHRFLKPVRGLPLADDTRTSTHHAVVVVMMSVYKLLWESAARGHVLFPRGVFQLPDADGSFRADIIGAMEPRFKCWAVPLAPVLVYKKLNKSWTNDHPGEHRVAYCAQVSVAIRAVSAAGVVMLDCRPANIMWQHKKGKLRVKLIDIEHVLPAGHVIETSVVDAHAVDKRYDVTTYDVVSGRHYASTRTNDHWLTFVTAWAESANLRPAKKDGATSFRLPANPQRGSDDDDGGGGGRGGGGADDNRKPAAAAQQQPRDLLSPEAKQQGASNNKKRKFCEAARASSNDASLHDGDGGGGVVGVGGALRDQKKKNRRTRRSKSEPPPY
jgi:hypothetical protein